MFTGLVQAVGTVSVVEVRPSGMRLGVDVGSWGYGRKAKAGDSVSVAGVCLTLVGRPVGRARNTEDAKPSSVAPRKARGVFLFDVVKETLDKTRLGELRVGTHVNLEHAATASTLMGGHIVQGHVDGVGRVARVETGLGGENWRVWVEVPKGMREFLVSKGSVCVEGVSLTIAGVTAKGFWVALIPTTLEVTTLAELAKGDLVNVEVDVVAKMVAAQIGKKKRGHR